MIGPVRHIPLFFFCVVAVLPDLGDKILGDFDLETDKFEIPFTLGVSVDFDGDGGGGIRCVRVVTIVSRLKSKIH